MALAGRARSAVSSWCRPVAMRVAAGPGDAIHPAQFAEPLDVAGPDMGSFAPSFSDGTCFLEQPRSSCP